MKNRRVHWLGLIVAAALVIRLVALAGIYFVKPTGTLFLDDQSYHNRAWEVASSLRKGVLVSSFDAGETSLKAVLQDPIVSFYPYWVAVLYLIFGSHVLVAQIGNVLLALGMLILVYSLGRGWFSESVGIGAAIMFAFWPSLVFWSVLNLKDVLVSLAGYAGVWIGLRVMKRPVGIHLLLAFPLLWLLFHLSVRLWMVLLGWLFLCSVVSEGNWRKKSISVIGVCLLGVSFSWTPFVRDRIVREALFGHPGRVIRVHQEAARRGLDPLDAGEEVEQEFFAGFLMEDPYSGVVKESLSGVRLLLFSPLPWNAVSRARELAALEAVLFIFMLFFSLWGFIEGARNTDRRRTAYLLMIFLVVIIFLYGAFEGNVGTALRHRAVVLPGFFLFAAAGLLDGKNRVFGRLSRC